MDREFRLQTEFTRAQLERLAVLMSVEHGKHPSPDNHNLLRKLTEYCANANHVQRLRRTA
jgi:hypothetical protein